MYDGFGEFINVLEELVRRPRHSETPPTQRNADRRWGLPLVCLVRDEQAAEVLRDICTYLKRSRPTPVPHALYEFSPDKVTESAAAPETPNEPATYTDLALVAETLFELAKTLSARGHKKYGRVRFRRFELVRWLMSQRLDGNQVEQDADLSSRLKRYERDRWRRRAPAESVEQTVTAAAPWWAQIPLRLVPWLWFGLRLRFGVKYRWFRRQSFLAPHDPGTFSRLRAATHRLAGRRTGTQDRGRVARGVARSAG